MRFDSDPPYKAVKEGHLSFAVISRDVVSNSDFQNTSLHLKGSQSVMRFKPKSPEITLLMVQKSG